MLIVLLFFFSGATALVYEIIWAKDLALLLGSTIQAQTVVLAVFMGGLAAGNKLFGRRSDFRRRPLFNYGMLEFAVGLYALVFGGLFASADRAFVLLGAPLLGHSTALLFLKGTLSVGLLAVPTMLMGGTLPMLAAWLHRRFPAEAGRKAAALYAVNTSGAVCGAAFGGFYLVPTFGLPATLALAGVGNLAIGIAAMLVGRADRSVVDDAEASVSPPTPALGRLLVGARITVALSGAIAMALEVLASRCLVLVFGSSLQAFTIVLIAFVAGIGVGSAIVSSAKLRRGGGAATSLLLLGAALLMGLLVGKLVGLVEFYRLVRSGLTTNGVGYLYYQVILTALALVILGLPAALLGAVLPLWIRVVSASSEAFGRRVGQLLTWNTIGGVVGSLLAGFILLPMLDLRGALVFLAGLAIVGAVATAWGTGRRRLLIPTVAVAGVLALIALRRDEVWRYALTSGVFRIQEVNPAATPIAERAKATRLVFYEDAADATVSVERDIVRPDPELVLRINGKADASSHGDLSTQILLGQLPMLMRPGSREVFCFGLGSGITAGTVLGYPQARLTIAENCAPVLRAAALFSPWNNGVLTNPRARIYAEDARTVLKLGRQQYDAIIAEPSNPWMVNVGSVFSLEFYRLAAQRLKPGGIMTQWFHTYEMDDATVDLVLRTFNRVFPAMEVWDAGGGDIILLGSDRPWRCSPDVFATAFQLERPRRDLAAIGLRTPVAILARQLASQRTAYAIAGPGAYQTDAHPILEYAAPRAMFVAVGQQAEQLQRFDERTYQFPMASPEKNRALAQIGDEVLKSVFYDGYPSVNPGFQQYVRSRVENNGEGDVGLMSMPCVFRPLSQTMIFEPAVAQTNPLVQRLCDAESLVVHDPDHCSAAVATIRRDLDAVRNYDRWNSGWSAAYFAYVGSEAGLHLGLAADAKAILLRGLALEPDSQELNYLSRILRREGLLTPNDTALPHPRT